MDVSRKTFLPFLHCHTRALTSQQSLLKQEPRGPSGPGPQAIKDFCKISGPCLHPHPEAASLSGFKPVEWTEVTTQGLLHPPMSSCSSSEEEEEEVPARGSVWSLPGRQVQMWKVLQQLLFILSVRLLTGCVTSTRHLCHFFWEGGDKQANAHN